MTQHIQTAPRKKGAEAALTFKCGCGWKSLLSAGVLEARIEAAAGRLERAAQMLEKSRQIRILKEERESEISAARAQRLVLEWMGQSEQAHRLATQYQLAAQTTGRPEILLPVTVATTVATPKDVLKKSLRLCSSSLISRPFSSRRFYACPNGIQNSLS
jgi:hypothetical protein